VECKKAGTIVGTVYKKSDGEVLFVCSKGRSRKRDNHRRLTEAGDGSMPLNEVRLDLGEESVEELVDSGRAAWAEKKFFRLRDEWKAQRGHESSTMKTVMLPAYQKIIGMGLDAVPLLLRELEGNIDNWFWALMAITEEDPVSDESRGDGEAMAQAWLKWGKDRGYEW
jgi:hypothetical protein